MQHGYVDESKVDQALARMYTKAFKLGLFDGLDGTPGGPYAALGPADVDTAANRGR